jgi:hypothetical protein
LTHQYPLHQYPLDAQAFFAYIAFMKKTMSHPPPPKDMEPAEEGTPDARWMDRIRKTLAALPPRIWTVGGAAVLVFAIGWCMLAPDQREAPRTPTSSGAAGTVGTVNSQSPASAVSPDTAIPENELVFIQAVRLQPSQPTRMDSLKAEVVATPIAPERLAYIYRWKVNDQVIVDEAGDTLNLSPFKKGDLITVTVTPHDGDTYGHAVESPVISVHSVPPSLELKAARQVRKTGEPIELQLVGTAPDGNLVTFSLEPPLVPGMTIDGRSGKISWLLQPDQKGTVRFGAAVVDDNGTKVTKNFDITLD